MEIGDNFLRCPLSSLIFYDPIIVNDGRTYEKEFITKHFTNNNYSPSCEGVRLFDDYGRLISLKNKDRNNFILKYIEMHPNKITEIYIPSTNKDNTHLNKLIKNIMTESEDYNELIKKNFNLIFLLDDNKYEVFSKIKDSIPTCYKQRIYEFIEPSKDEIEFDEDVWYCWKVFDTEYILDVFEKLIDGWDGKITPRLENFDNKFCECFEYNVIRFDIKCIKKLYEIKAKLKSSGESDEDSFTFLQDCHIEEHLCLSNIDKKYTIIECIEFLTNLNKHFLMYHYLKMISVKDLECFTDMLSTEQKNFITNTFINYISFEDYHIPNNKVISLLMLIIENDFCNSEQKEIMQNKLNNMKRKIHSFTPIHS